MLYNMEINKTFNVFQTFITIDNIVFHLFTKKDKVSNKSLNLFKSKEILYQKTEKLQNNITLT